MPVPYPTKCVFLILAMSRRILLRSKSMLLAPRSVGRKSAIRLRFLDYPDRTWITKGRALYRQARPFIDGPFIDANEPTRWRCTGQAAGGGFGPSKRASKTSDQSQPSPCLWVKASEAGHLSNSPAGATSDGMVEGGMKGSSFSGGKSRTKGHAQRDRSFNSVLSTPRRANNSAC